MSRPGSRPARLTRVEQMLILVFLVAFAAEQYIVADAFAEMERTDRAYEEATLQLTTTANAQRESLLLIHLVDELVRGGSTMEVQRRRQMLERQLSLIDARLPSDGPLRDRFAAVEATLQTFDDLLHQGAGTTPGELVAALRALEVTTKRLNDTLEVPFYELQSQAGERRRSARIWLVSGTLGLLLAGGALAVLLRRRYRRTFDCAYTALLDYNAALEQVNEELTDVARAKDQFISAVSHELRTPLTVVSGRIQVLSRRWRDLSDAERQHSIEAIERNTRRQQRLIDDLMAMAGVVSGSLQAQPREVSLRDAVRDAWEAAGQEIDVRIAPAVDVLHVYADADHLHQMLANLLTNARKYGAPPVEVTVLGHGSAVEITVRDHGEGVPDHYVPRLFEPFTQAEQGDGRARGGLGIGLAIVRGLSEMNGGTVAYRPPIEVGGGAAFVLTLPSTPTNRCLGEAAEAAVQGGGARS